MTKFGAQYKDHPTPKWVLIFQATLEYLFATIAAGTMMVPDNWLWWKFVVAAAGLMAGLMAKLKPYFGIETVFPVDQNTPIQ